MKVLIGLDQVKEAYNPSKESIPDGQTEHRLIDPEHPDTSNAWRPAPGLRVLPIDIADDMKMGEAFVTLTAEGRGIIDNHTDVAPLWVECLDRPSFATLLADNYGCPIGAPADVEATHWTESGPPGVGPAGPIETAVTP